MQYLVRKNILLAILFASFTFGFQSGSQAESKAGKKRKSSSQESENPFAVNFSRELKDKNKKNGDSKVIWHQKGLHQFLHFKSKSGNIRFDPVFEYARLIPDGTEFISWPKLNKNYLISTWQIGVNSQTLAIFDLSAPDQNLVFQISSDEEISYQLTKNGNLKIDYVKLVKDGTVEDRVTLAQSIQWHPNFTK